MTFGGRSAPPPGLNVAGFFRAEFGVGESGRLLARAVEASGIPWSSLVYGETDHRQGYVFSGPNPPRAVFDTNIVCISGDALPGFAAEVGLRFFDRRYTIGLWHWEVTHVPQAFAAAAGYVDELWVASDFTQQALQGACSVPVHKFPMPVVYESPDDVDRSALGIPDGYVFLFVFDFLSEVERKNPLGLINAYCGAFDPDDGTRLVLKTVNGHLRPEALRSVHEAARPRSDITVLDGFLSHEDKHALMSCCDCYVSLHRGEGFGLTMAEAMSLGKPVIATGYSGNLEFMTDENSFLVPYQMTEIPPGCGPYPPGATWADPDIEVAAEYMRHVVSSPEQAERRAAKGERDVLARSVDVAGGFVRRRFTDIQTMRASASGTTRRGSTAGRAIDPALRMIRRRLRGLYRSLRRAPRHLGGSSGEVAQEAGVLRRAVRVLTSLPPARVRRSDDRSATSARPLSVIEWLRAASAVGGDFPVATLRPQDAERDRARVLLDRVRKELDSVGEDTLRYFDPSRPRYEYALAIALGEARGRVLDLGCSPGHLGWALGQAGFEVWGIDLGTAWLAKYPPGWAETLRVRQANVDTEPLPDADASFDLVLFTEVIEHLAVHHPQRILSEIRRVLKPGGLLLLSTPNVCNASHMLALAKGRNVFWPPHLFYGSTDRHNREFTPRELTSLVEQAGFERYEVGYMNTWSNWNHETAPILHEVLAAEADLAHHPLFNNTIFIGARR